MHNYANGKPRSHGIDNPVVSLETIKYDGETFVQTDYDGYYVSRSGRVGSIRDNKGRLYESNFHILKQNKNSAGYFQIYVSIGNKRRAVMVHKLVAYAFLGKRPYGYDIDHINAIRTDNRAENLQYLSRQQNIKKSKLGTEPHNIIRVIANGVYYPSIKVFRDCTGFKKSKLDLFIRDNGVRSQNKRSRFFVTNFKKTVETIEIDYEIRE